MQLVRNDARHDARVARAAATMADAGLEPVVVAVVSGAVTARRGRLGVAPVIRLAPRSLAARVRPKPTVSPSPPTSTQGPGSVRSGVGPLARLNRTLTALDFHRQALGAVRALRPELLHCNDHNTMWTGVLARVLWGTPVVYDAHELWADRNGRWEWRPGLIAAEALFVRAAGAVVTASPGYAAELARRYRIPAPQVVLNVPDATPPAQAPQRDGDPALVYVGGLMPGRGLEVAIRALALLPAARLDLIGPGRADYIARLAAIAAEAGVTDRVRFVAPVAPEAVVDRIAGYDAGLSLIEPICRSYELTLPNKVFEYLAAGVPVLAGPTPTQAAFVRGARAGAVVGVGDVHAVAAALRRLPEWGTCAAPPAAHQRARLRQIYRDAS